MTRKRFKGLLMATGVQRNEAERIAKIARAYGSYSKFYEKYQATKRAFSYVGNICVQLWAAFQVLIKVYKKGF